MLKKVGLVLTSFLAYYKSAKKRKKLYLKKRFLIEQQIQINKWLLTYWTQKNKRNRSCWVSPDLLNSQNCGFWETQVPFLSGKIKYLLHFITTYI